MKENKYISELLKEIQTEKAPKGTTLQIMQKIEARTVKQRSSQWWQMLPVFYVIALIGVSRIAFIYFLENYVSIDMVVSKIQEYAYWIVLKTTMFSLGNIVGALSIIALLIYLFVEDRKARSCCRGLPFA